MNPELSALLWAELERATGDIPWPALHTIAKAAVTDPEVARKLFEVFDRAYEGAVDHDTYADLYVPAIFALEAGLDVTDPQVKHSLAERQLDEFVAGLPTAPAKEHPPGEEPPFPIFERSPEPARNAPCPCGSGRKYKKCHGRPEARQTSDR